MAKALPYYPLYVDDFDEDPNVLAMNLAEVGLYQLALNESWKRGSIPAEPKELAVLIRRKPSEVCRAWPKVQPCWINNCIPGRLVNPRQEREREKANELSIARSEAARISHLPSSRRVREVSAHAEHLQPYESVSESSPTQPTNQEGTSTGARVDFATFMHRWKAHRGFKKPRKNIADHAEYRWQAVKITEEDLVLAMDGYQGSGWARQHEYPILGFIKNPHSWIANLEEPMDDGGFDEFQALYPGVSIPSDWDKAKPIWCSLPSEDRAKARDHIGACDPAYVKSPRNYLKDREFMRPPRPKPKSDLEKMMEAL